MTNLKVHAQLTIASPVGAGPVGAGPVGAGPAALAGSDLGGRLLDVIEAWRSSLPEPIQSSGQSSGQMARIQTMIEYLRADLGRKPRVVILGEFNSGKTTLANVLARTSALPTSVLANTRQAAVIQRDSDAPDRLLAPMKLAAGDGRFAAAFGVAEGLDYTVTTARGPLLATCTIIDTAGIGDPSFLSSTTSRLASLADVAIWCSPATQCWKASERATWDNFARRPRWRNLLVITGADMLRGPDELNRVLTRLETESGRRFDGIHPLNALDALSTITATGDVADCDIWEYSGAADLESAVRLHARAAHEQRRNRAGRWANRLLRQLDQVEDSELTRLIFLRLPRRSRPDSLALPPRPSRVEARALGKLKAQLLGLRQQECHPQTANGAHAARRAPPDRHS